MRPILRSCCGIDVHKSMIKACIAKGPLNKPPKIEIRTYSTMTSDLENLNEWLKENKVEAVAMESTGVYWKPIFNILESDFPVSIANPKYLKKVPGKKTDVSDSEWIATLLRCGLIPKSFIPTLLIRELRDLNRTRRKMVEHMASEKNRLQKVLGVNKSGKIRKGNKYLKATLCEAAWSASKKKGSAYSAYYAKRRGKKRALVALAHRMLMDIYRTLKAGEPYVDEGAEAVFERNSSGRQKSAIRFLEKSGYVVTKASA